MVGDAVVQSHPRRVDNRTRAYVFLTAENVATTKIVNGAFANEKISVGAESTERIFDYRPCNKAFLFIHVAGCDRIHTADFYDGTDAAQTYKGDVSSCGDGEILSLH